MTEDRFHQIATVNPEFILEAEKNEEFKNILNACDFNVVDGIGIKYAFLYGGKWLKTRLTGIDLMHEILSMADKRSLNVFLAINKGGLSSFEDIKSALGKMYPNITFCGDEIDYPNATHSTETITCDLLLCNFGAPRQELFIDSIKNDSIRLAMGVGGSFDFVTGKLKRAPKLMRTFGLEWLWRLIQEPGYRIRRIFRAVIIFPFKIIFHKRHE